MIRIQKNLSAQAVLGIIKFGVMFQILLIMAVPVRVSAMITSSSGRLADNVRPISYKIHISPQFSKPIENLTDFDGNVMINIAVLKTTKTIVLHVGEKLTIHSVEIRGPTGDLEHITSFQIAKITEILTIKMNNDLTANSATFYTINIIYSGKFEEGFYFVRGFYKNIYKKGNNDIGAVLNTHFQPTYARRTFPCFDEPQWKATFVVVLDVIRGYEALSNTPVDTQTSVYINGTLMEQITFKETVNMSTYMLGFIIYEKNSFIRSHSVSSRGVLLTSWARKTAVDNKLTDFSQDISFKVLRQLEHYTGIPYKRGNMIKIDQIALPNLASGAVENWGLIFYYETRLLYNSTKDTEEVRKGVAMTIAHELSHQWFGNLVTTKWWDTTWMNEGFGRYFSYQVLSRIYPNWRMMDQFLVDQQMTIFKEDSIPTTPPLTNYVSTPLQIRGQFVRTTYQKGASLMRMISYLMGESNFQAGLQQFLKREYQPATPHDLFEDLNKYIPAERKPAVTLEESLDSWFLQSGFPLVTIERNYTLGTCVVSQKRFFIDDTKENDGSQTLYHVPITWSTKFNASPQFFWLHDNITLTELPDAEQWLLVHATGYFRVTYDEANWMKLTASLAGEDSSHVSPADRAQIVDDAMTLARVGRLHYSVVGSVLRYLTQETDIIPWAAATPGLRFLQKLIGSVNSGDVFYTYLRHATAAVYSSLKGFSPCGDPPELIHRRSLLHWACRAGSAQCLQEAAFLLERHLKNAVPLDPNLKDVILCHGIRADGNKLWEDLWNMYIETNDTTLLHSLGCVEDPATIHMFLKKVASSDDRARYAVVLNAFRATVSHPKGAAATLNFVLENLNEMRNWLSTDMIRSTLMELADHLTSEIQLQKLIAKLEPHMRREDVNIIIAGGEQNVKWMQAHGEEALQAFADAITADSSSNAAILTAKLKPILFALSLLVTVPALTLIMSEYIK